MDCSGRRSACPSMAGRSKTRWGSPQFWHGGVGAHETHSFMAASVKVAVDDKKNAWQRKVRLMLPDEGMTPGQNAAHCLLSNRAASPLRSPLRIIALNYRAPKTFVEPGLPPMFPFVRNCVTTSRVTLSDHSWLPIGGAEKTKSPSGRGVEQRRLERGVGHDWSLATCLHAQ